MREFFQSKIQESKVREYELGRFMGERESVGIAPLGSYRGAFANVQPPTVYMCIDAAKKTVEKNHRIIAVPRSFSDMSVFAGCWENLIINRRRKGL